MARGLCLVEDGRWTSAGATTIIYISILWVYAAAEEELSRFAAKVTLTVHQQSSHNNGGGRHSRGGRPALHIIVKDTPTSILSSAEPKIAVRVRSISASDRETSDGWWSRMSERWERRKWRQKRWCNLERTNNFLRGRRSIVSKSECFSWTVDNAYYYGAAAVAVRSKGTEDPSMNIITFRNMQKKLYWLKLHFILSSISSWYVREREAHI